MTILLALASLVLSRRADSWPHQLDDPSWKPHIGYLRQSSAIAGQPVVSPKLQWNGDGANVKWTLLDAPAGMKINPSKKIQWASPVEGRYLVRLRAEVDGSVEEAGWLLNVVKTNFPNPVIYSTKHIDYLVPQWYGEWMDRTNASRVVDAYYEFGRDLVGGCPCDARQSILYDPHEGGAHNGIPIVAGDTPFGDNDDNHWRLGYLFHELGHNLNPYIRVDYLEGGDGQLDTWLHGMVEFDKIAWVMRMLANPDKQGTNDVAHFTEWMKAESMEFVGGFQDYMKEVPKGAEFAKWTNGPSVVWAGMVHEFAFKYGGDALEKVLRCMRRDGLQLADYPDRRNSIDRLNILMCIMSNAVGHDIRDEFKAMHMPINDKLFVKFNGAVANTMAHLPALGKNGAVVCPADNHYYCLTPYHMTWAEAESTARRLGGHLATIRSEAQERWLATLYGRNGWMWVGCRRGTDNSWSWITGEKTDQPIWEPERPESDPNKTCGVLILHEDGNKNENPWFGLANRPADEQQIGIIEFDHVPALDADALP